MTEYPEEKLIRDRVPEIIREATGSVMHVRTATDDELPLLAKAKLIEEAGGAVSSPPEGIVEELAGVVEAVRLVAHVYGYTEQEVEKARASKAEQKGTFSSGTVGRFRVSHAGQHTKFCVLCLTGEHKKDVDGESLLQKRRWTIKFLMERVANGTADPGEIGSLKSLIDQEFYEHDITENTAKVNLHHVRTLITDIMNKNGEDVND